MVPGIIGAVVVAVAGAISSFIAYQKKKLCFKENSKSSMPASFVLCVARVNAGLSLKTNQQTKPRRDAELTWG